MTKVARGKILITSYIDAEVMQRLEAWKAKQEFPPTTVRILELALTEFVDKRERKK